MSVIGINRTLISDGYIQESGLLLISDAVLHEENIFVDFAADALIIDQKRITVLIFANIESYAGAPVSVLADAVVYSDRVFP